MVYYGCAITDPVFPESDFEKSPGDVIGRKCNIGKFIYQFEGECLEKCPNKTIEDENFICKIKLLFS